MANKFYSWLLNRLRGIRFSSVTGTGYSSKNYIFGTIVNGSYRNFKKDPKPLVFVMWCGRGANGNYHTHGINLHYLDNNELMWFARNIFMIKKYQQMIDGRTFYTYLKTRMPSIVKKAYRVYFTQQTDFKMVSAGITNMEKFVYPSNEAFIQNLNRTISPQAIIQPPKQVAFSSTELRERIIESQNSISLYGNNSAIKPGMKSATF